MSYFVVYIFMSLYFVLHPIRNIELLMILIIDYIFYNNVLKILSDSNEGQTACVVNQ
jgi:hypothetical protein